MFDMSNWLPSLDYKFSVLSWFCQIMTKHDKGGQKWPIVTLAKTLEPLSNSLSIQRKGE